MGRRVECKIVETAVENERGGGQPGIEVHCGRCDHVVKCYGTGEKSKKRGLMMLREECPQGEDNFYIDEEDA